MTWGLEVELCWCCTYRCHRWSTRRDGKHSYERPSRCVDIPLMNARSQYSASRQARFLLNHCHSADANTDRISFTVTQNMFMAYVFRRTPSIRLYTYYVSNAIWQWCIYSQFKNYCTSVYHATTFYDRSVLGKTTNCCLPRLRIKFGERAFSYSDPAP